MDSSLGDARNKLVSALGRQSSFWGVGKITGELYAVLYLSKEPISLTELADSLGVTKGNVSVAIRTLEQLGMVKRTQQTGDRQVYFEAIPDFWLIAQRILERRQKPEFDESFRILAESIELAQEADSNSGKEFVLERLIALHDFYNELDEVVAAILAVNPRRLSWLARIVSRFIKRKEKIQHTDHRHETI